MRIMAIDYGDERIGLAVSDALGLLCGDAWTMNEWNMERASQRIAEEAARREVGTLVLGLPKNMDGSEERRSSIEAHAILHAVGKKEKLHRRTVDAVAASLILEGYLGRQR